MKIATQFLRFVIECNVLDIRMFLSNVLHQRMKGG